MNTSLETIRQPSKGSALKRFGFLGIGLCAFLCALPIIGTALGVGVLSAGAFYFEKIGIGVLVVSVGLFAIWLVRRQKLASSPSCDINCDCKKHSVEKIKEK